MSTSSTRYDAIIVGARCAGASTAMLLARQGARVLVVDHDQPGTDTMSTHALMRGAVLQLHRWGVLDRIRASGAPPIRRTSFFYGRETVDVDIAPVLGTDALWAPRRRVLDAALVDAAVAAGAEFRFGTGCKGLLRDGAGEVVGIEARSESGSREDLRADLVIGADGRRSAVAREVRAAVLRRAVCASAVVYGYFDGLKNLGYRWFWGPGAGGGIIPTNDGLSCVFLAMTPEAFAESLPRRDEAGFAAAVANRLPVMAGHLSGARLASRPVTFRGEHGYMRQAHGPGWALVGDARRGRGVLQGPDHRARDHRCAAGCGTPRPCSRLGAPRDLCRDTGGAVRRLLPPHRRDCGLSLDAGGPEVSPHRPEPGDEA
nr:FAD-dependent monooxygenase [Acidobacteriota bacterium]